MAYKTKKMTKYKLRAEGMNDVWAFTNKHYASMGKYILSGYMYTPDVEFEFESSDSIETIKKILRTIPDSHVMRETLQPKSKYTGNRY
jgi:hypothetical protein